MAENCPHTEALAGNLSAVARQSCFFPVRAVQPLSRDGVNYILQEACGRQRRTAHAGHEARNPACASPHDGHAPTQSGSISPYSHSGSVMRAGDHPHVRLAVSKTEPECDYGDIDPRLQ